MFVEYICSNLVALLAALIFIISYSMYMYFLVLEIKPSQFINLTFAFYKLTIMTGNNVRFLIMKNTKKFANLWWLNLGTEFDLSTGWIFYCAQVKKFTCSWLKSCACFKILVSLVTVYGHFWSFRDLLPFICLKVSQLPHHIPMLQSS